MNDDVVENSEAAADDHNADDNNDACHGNNSKCVMSTARRKTKDIMG